MSAQPEHPSSRWTKSQKGYCRLRRSTLPFADLDRGRLSFRHKDERQAAAPRPGQLQREQGLPPLVDRKDAIVTPGVALAEARAGWTRQCSPAVSLALLRVLRHLIQLERQIDQRREDRRAAGGHKPGDTAAFGRLLAPLRRL
jgi:hypothetical protein